MSHGHVFEFDDPYKLQATLRAGNYEVVPLGKGSFHAERQRPASYRRRPGARVRPISVGETDNATEPFAHF
jgi:hypothetical protein